MIAHDRMFQLLGLEPGHGADRSVSLPDGQTSGVLSSRDPDASLIAPHRVKIRDLATLRELVTGDPSEPEVSKSLAAWTDEEDSAHWDDLGAGSSSKLRGALVSTALGHSQPGHFADALGRHFFPMPATLFAARDVTIAAGETFHIEPDGHDPVVCTFATLTLEEGGLIQVGAPAIVNVTTFRKTAA